VDSNKHKILLNSLRSQMIQEPSADALIAYSLFFFIYIDQTLPLCSLRETLILCVYFPIFQTLTSPSIPPEIIF